MVYGRFTETRKGARIDCRIGPQGLAIGVVLFAQLAVWGIFASWIVSGIIPHDWRSLLSAAIPPLLMSVFIALCMAFGRWIGRKNAAFLLDFLGMLLNTQPEEPDLPRHGLAAAERRFRGK